MGEHMFFNSKVYMETSLNALLLSFKICDQEKFTKDFVEKYVCRIKKILSEPPFPQETIHGLSQIILESDQRSFFLKLVSDFPEKAKIIPEDPNAPKSFPI